MTKAASQDAEKNLGSPAYQAPEVVTQETYTNAIDIFSLALSILATFEGCMWSSPLSYHEHYSSMLNHLTLLETRMPDGLATLLSSMLSWDSSHRPRAEDVLADAVWEQITEPDSVTSTSDRHSSGGISGLQWPDDGDLPLSSSDQGERGDRFDRRPQLPVPDVPLQSASSNSTASGADDFTQRMKRSDAPPPSSIANDDASSTAERMNRSDAPTPSSAANSNN